MSVRSALWSVAALVALGPWAAQAEILIGLAAPLTGAVSWAGDTTQQGAEMAVADLNARGGALGEVVEMIAVDDFCDPAQAVAAAEKLVAEAVVFVVGHICSAASIAASGVYAAAGVLMMSPASTNPELTERGLRNVFRLIGRDDEQGELAGDYLAEHRGEKRIAVLHDGTTYGRYLAEEVEGRLKARGAAAVLFEAIAPGRSDYSRVVEKLRAAVIDVVYYGGYAREAGLIVRQARDAGHDIRLVSGDGVSVEDFWLVAGPAGEGTIFTNRPDILGRPEAAAVLAKFRARGFGRRPNGITAYAAVQAWAQAVEEAGTTDPDAVAETLRNGEFDTLLGTIGFDDKGDVTGGVETFAWYIWRNGEHEPATPD